jgi:hypothetical protein
MEHTKHTSGRTFLPSYLSSRANTLISLRTLVFEYRPTPSSPVVASPLRILWNDIIELVQASALLADAVHILEAHVYLTATQISALGWATEYGRRIIQAQHLDMIICEV